MIHLIYHIFFFLVNVAIMITTARIWKLINIPEPFPQDHNSRNPKIYVPFALHRKRVYHRIPILSQHCDTFLRQRTMLLWLGTLDYSFVGETTLRVGDVGWLVHEAGAVPKGGDRNRHALPEPQTATWDPDHRLKCLQLQPITRRWFMGTPSI